LEQARLPVRAEGFWPCAAWSFPDEPMRERFFRACYRHGLSLYNVSYMNFSHGDDDVADVLRRFESVCAELR
jgi:hypothetical protein